MRVNIIIECHNQQFEVNLSHPLDEQLNADGHVVVSALGHLWDRARDDGQAWVNARRPHAKGA